jgi:hypothetical protein
MIIPRCVVQKLCEAKNFLPPGLSIANLRYRKIPIDGPGVCTFLRHIKYEFDYIIVFFEIFYLTVTNTITSIESNFEKSTITSSIINTIT